jgi:hypothetical protein
MIMAVAVVETQTGKVASVDAIHTSQADPICSRAYTCSMTRGCRDDTRTASPRWSRLVVVSSSGTAESIMIVPSSTGADKGPPLQEVERSTSLDGTCVAGPMDTAGFR